MELDKFDNVMKTLVDYAFDETTFDDYKRFYTLTVLCFLRSIRINGDLKEWKAPQHPRTATPSEILFLGLHYYLESLPANIYQ